MIETLDEAARKHATICRDGCCYSEPSNKSFIAGANWMREQFTLYGTTDCNSCDDGRATLYITLKGLCVACAQTPKVGGKDG
jgi:hypothetical protein